MTTKATDFSRLTAAARVLGATGDVSGARALLSTARELSEVAICIKCSKRRQREAEALKALEADLTNGSAAADGRHAVEREVAR